MTTHHSGDDKDDDKGEGGEEDDEDDVVGREQGGGGEEVGVHLPHLEDRIGFMSSSRIYTLVSCKQILGQSCQNYSCASLSTTEVLSALTLIVVNLPGGLLLFPQLRQLPPRVLKIEDPIILRNGSR